MRPLCVPKTSSVLALERIIYDRSEMIVLMCFCLRLFTLPFKSKIRLEAENAILRRQLIVLERKIRGRVRFTNSRNRRYRAKVARLQTARGVVLELHGVQIGLDVSLNLSGMTVAIGS
jgi:hypothetical protein